MTRSRAHINTGKIKGIIACYMHKGKQLCADKINSGGFAPPSGSKKWEPEHIKPMMDGEISLKVSRPPKVKMMGVSVSVRKEIYDIIFKNSATNAEFIRSAINEKIEREGLS